MLIAVASGCGGDDDKPVTTTGETVAQAPTVSVETPTAPETTSTEPETIPTAPETTPTEPDEAPTGDTETPPAPSSTSPAPPSSGDDKEAASQVALGFVKALASGDGGTACDAMSNTVRQQVEKGFGSAPQFKGKRCEEILSRVSEGYPDQARDGMRDLRVLRVTIDGKAATVEYKPGNLPKATVPLMRVDGTWKIGGVATGAQG